MKRRRQFLAVVSSAGLGAVAGCSGTDSDTSTTVANETGTSGSNNTSESESTATDSTLDPPQTPDTRAATLVATEGESETEFGFAVAVSADGSTAVVGARKDADPNGEDAGSAYVYDRSDGEWSQQAKLTPDDGEPQDQFGQDLSISDDGTAVIVGTASANAAYLFARAGGSWDQQATLATDAADFGSQLGYSVALSGDGSTAVVGAAVDGEPNGSASGSAHVFEAVGSEWRHRAELVPADGDADDLFGIDVAIDDDGTTVVAGANGDEDPNGVTDEGRGAGSAYVFDLSGDNWSERAKLLPNDGEAGDSFGFSVAVSGDGTTAVVGARLATVSDGDGTGSVYVFDKTGGWGAGQKRLSTGDRIVDNFGWAVATAASGRVVLVGATRDTPRTDALGGGASVYVRSDESWRHVRTLRPADGTGVLLWDAALSADGSTALVGSLDAPKSSESATVFD